MRPEEHLANLVAAEARGRRLKFVLFWGHQPEKDGTIGKGCLSQWWPVPFTVDGTEYATAEHWMMAAKARLFGDDEALKRLPDAKHPAEAKAIGRAVTPYDERTWAAHRYDLVVEGNLAKFGQNPELKAYLLGTGTRILVEASPRDRIWGIGMAASDEGAESPSRWRGRNLLGFALMDVRELLSRPG